MSSWTGGAAAAEADAAKLKDFEAKVDPGNKEATAMLEEMRAHTAKLAALRKNEDPRLSFSTPEFKEASRVFSEAFKKNFGKPVEWGLVKRYPWQEAVLMKLDTPLKVDGTPWPLDAAGKPIVEGA